MPERRHLHIDGTVSELPGVLAFADAACQEAGADSSTAFAVRLALEEAFMNLVTHGYGGAGGPIDFDVDTLPEELVITISDQAAPFDPADVPAADTESSWEARPVGGLGWHLIRQMMDEVRYEPGSGKGNRLTLVKRM